MDFLVVKRVGHQERSRYGSFDHMLDNAVAELMKRYPTFKYFTWHDLRRTCGCRLFQEYNLPMIEVSRWLGHSSIEVTEKHYAFLGSKALENARVRVDAQRLVEATVSTVSKQVV